MARKLQTYVGDKRTVVVTVVQIGKADIHLEYRWQDAWVGTVLQDAGITDRNGCSLQDGGRPGLTVGGRSVCTGTLLRHLDRLRVYWKSDPLPPWGSASSFTPSEPEDEPEECGECECGYPDDPDDGCECWCHD